jgi:hypothetical protein
VAVAGRLIHQQEQVAPQQLVSLVAAVVLGHRRTQAGQPELVVLHIKAAMLAQMGPTQTFKLVVVAVAQAALVVLARQPRAVQVERELVRQSRDSPPHTVVAEAAVSGLQALVQAEQAQLAAEMGAKEHLAQVVPQTEEAVAEAPETNPLDISLEVQVDLESLLFDTNCLRLQLQTLLRRQTMVHHQPTTSQSFKHSRSLVLLR